MKKIIVSEFVALDGVMEAPGGEPGHPHSGWVRDFMGEDALHYKLDEVLDAESLLIGRVTYESFAGAWPQRSGEFADKMNAMPKHVVSTTLLSPAWRNCQVIRATCRRGSRASRRERAAPSWSRAAGRWCTP